MKKKYIKITTIFLLIVLLSINICFAAKEKLDDDDEKYLEMETEDLKESGVELGVDGYHDLYKKYEVKEEFNGEILEKMTNKDIAQLNWLNLNSLGPNQLSVMDKSYKFIDLEYNRRRTEAGLEENHNSAVGIRSQNSNSDDITYYYLPERSEKDKDDNTKESLDDSIGDADNFINNADDTVGQVNQSALQNFSSIFYNIFLTVGTVIAVISGMVIGIKYMAGSIEEKATYKEMLLPYGIGCIVLFGSFAIWKIVIEIMKAL